MTATEYVVLVNQDDQVVGQAEKMAAHQQHLLHRAFSVFVYYRSEKTGEVSVLLQQRAQHKYHSGGLWTNTCCSHPRPGEPIVAAAERRLLEEMRIQAELHVIGQFHYEVHFSNTLSENELDYVLAGKVQAMVNDQPLDVNPNPDEVHAYQWMRIIDIQDSLMKHPERYTAWFERAFAIFLSYLLGEKP